MSDPMAGVALHPPSGNVRHLRLEELAHPSAHPTAHHTAHPTAHPTALESAAVSRRQLDSLTLRACDELDGRPVLSMLVSARAGDCETAEIEVTEAQAPQAAGARPGSAELRFPGLGRRRQQVMRSARVRGGGGGAGGGDRKRAGRTGGGSLLDRPASRRALRRGRGFDEIALLDVPAPFGMLSPVIVFEPTARRYIHQQGARPKHCAELAPVRRANAQRKPRAIMHGHRRAPRHAPCAEDSGALQPCDRRLSFDRRCPHREQPRRRGTGRA